LNDPLWGDAPEYLPDGSAILVRDINKAISGEDFNYYPEGEGVPENISGIQIDIWPYYLQVFNYCEDFGLPHGKGWIDELPWVPDFLSFMKRQKMIIENWRVRQSYKTKG